MSGDQEPWVFRGGLTADLQVSCKICKINVCLLNLLPASCVFVTFCLHKTTGMRSWPVENFRNRYLLFRCISSAFFRLTR